MKHIESEIQQSCVKWFKYQYPGMLIHHSPNGGKRNVREAARFKAMGTLSGWPDLFIAAPRSCFAGLFIEMKSDKGRATDNQERVQHELLMAGYGVRVCRSLDEFMKIVNEYMNL